MFRTMTKDERDRIDELLELGYVTGQNRKPDDDCVAHLYKGDYDNPGMPMCQRGYNRVEGYSIWRGNVGRKGFCKTCMRRALAGKDGVLRKEKVE